MARPMMDNGLSKIRSMGTVELINIPSQRLIRCSE